MTENQYFSKIAIDLIKDYTERGYENAVACIDWLKKISQEDSTCSENQGEKNPCETCEEPRLNCQNFPCEKKKNFKYTDKVEPKFHEGDWILYSGDHYEGVRHITKINENGYYIERNGLPHGIIPFNHEICMRLWAIQDAKDGDVLATPNYIYIFNSIDKETEIVSFYCLMKKSDEHFSFSDYKIHDEILNSTPATKEQCDLLFQMMKESGFEWDAKNKEVKKVEDEEYDGEDYGIDSLFHAQTILERTLGKVDGYQSDDGILEHKCAITAVKKLYEQKLGEWSEEDERTYKSIIYSFDHNYPLSIQQQEFIKSLIPQKQWKPSNEQMIALSEALGIVKMFTPKEAPRVTNLQSLYNDLKKII